MNSVPNIFFNKQSILMLPMDHSPIPMRNHIEENESKGFVIQHSRIQVGHILLLDTKCSGKSCDSQNVLLNSNKPCGCFILKSSRSNIISMHSSFFQWQWQNKDDEKIQVVWNFWRHSQKVTSQWTSIHQGCNKANDA